VSARLVGFFDCLLASSLKATATLSASEGFINALRLTYIGGKQPQPDEMVIG